MEDHARNEANNKSGIGTDGNERANDLTKDTLENKS